MEALRQAQRLSCDRGLSKGETKDARFQSHPVQHGNAGHEISSISQIPILEIARALGLEVRGRKATCLECKKKRLTFSVKFNCWRCWNCDPAGKRKTVIDLVMFILNVDAFNTATWIKANGGMS